MKNDVSFLFDERMSLYEHQSTVCPNMTFRGLKYFASLMESYVRETEQNEYSQKPIRLPTPRYVVFYNGEQDAPDEDVLRFSDLCAEPGASCVEVTARVLNINYGHNEALMRACETLRGYAYFIAKIRELLAEGLEFSEAVNRAVDLCIQEGVLSDYLKKNREGVVDMLITEYDEQYTMNLFRKEAFADGREEGLEAGLAAGREAGLEEGLEAGLEAGENRLGSLIECLAADGKQDEIVNVSTNKELRNEYYRMYNL